MRLSDQLVSSSQQTTADVASCHLCVEDHAVCTASDVYTVSADCGRMSRVPASSADIGDVERGPPQSDHLYTHTYCIILAALNFGVFTG